MFEPNMKTLQKYKFSFKIFEENYQKLSDILDLAQLRKKGYLTLVSHIKGIMDLNADFLRDENNNDYIIALSHYHTQRGDSLADPDMELRVNDEKKTIEALTYQDRYSYKNVYMNHHSGLLLNVRFYKELNEFLSTWLTNIKHQLNK